MKVVLNKAYGGFHIPAPLLPVISTDWYDDSIEVRTDERLIEWVEHNKHKTDLRVVETDEGEVTDFYISEYDGMETLIYVIGGKLHFA